MRIWLVQRAESTPHDDGGARRLMRMGILANQLQERGHIVTWWTSAFDHVSHKRRYDKSTRMPVGENYSIHYLKCFGYKTNISISRAIDNIYVAEQFSKEARRETEWPDVMLVSLPSIELAKHAVEYAVERKIPVFLDIRDLWPDVFRDLVPKYIRWLIGGLTLPMTISLKRVCKNATGILGITDEFVNWGVEHGGRLPSAKDVTFPMAYVKQKSSVGDADAELFWRGLGVRCDSQTLYVLFLGTFTRSFDFRTVFSAAEKLCRNNVRVKFIFCGTGRMAKYVKERCAGLDNCIFAGWVNAPQIQVALKLASVGLAPYMELPNFVDNLPNKPAEYLSEGLAIANGMGKGVLYDLIRENGCGFSYRGSADTLADGLSYYAGHTDAFEEVRASARRIFEERLDGQHIYSSLAAFLENQVNISYSN